MSLSYNNYGIVRAEVSSGPIALKRHHCRRRTSSTGRHATARLACRGCAKASVALADQIDEGAILAMHEALMRTGHPSMAGHWRSQQVWIGGAFGIRGADFIAPHHERIEFAIADLLTFA
jgi:hypothetical protein